MLADSRLWAIVLAGGNGTRLRSVVESMIGEPLPKQFCAFGGRRSLLQLTLLRTLPVVPPGRCAVVVAAEHRGRAEDQLRGFPGVRIIDQPGDLGTSAGVLLPLAHILEADSRARVLLLPSDHVFADEDLMLRGIDEVDRAVAAGGADVVLFGVVPDAPHGDYGWIGVDGAAGEGALRKVAGFWEKPGMAVAQRLRSQGALWNTMILLARASALRELYGRHLPAMDAAFRMHALMPAGERPRFLDTIYRRLDPADFSRDLLARADGLVVHPWPQEVGWSDIGIPSRLFAWMGAESQLHASP